MRSRTLPILEMSRNEMRGLLLDMEPGSKSVPARTRLRRRKISLHAHIALRRILIEAIRYNGALRRQRSWSRITSPTRTQTHHDQRAKNEGRFERRGSNVEAQTWTSNLDVKLGRQTWKLRPGRLASGNALPTSGTNSPSADRYSRVDLKRSTKRILLARQVNLPDRSTHPKHNKK